MKKSAILLCVAMIAGSFGTLGVSAKNDSAEISIFDTFSEYKSEKGGELPYGWMVRREDRQPGIGMAVDSERNSRTMKLRTGAEATLPFNANFDTGKIHISYDAKLTATELEGEEADYNKSLMTKMSANETTSQSDQYDYTSIPDGGDSAHYAFNTGNESKNVPVYAFNNSWKWMGTRGYDQNKIFTNETWHKIELFIDADTKQYSSYLDGQLVSCTKYENGEYTDAVNSSFTSDLTNNFKALILDSGMGSEMGAEGSGAASDDGGFMIDNVYVRSYDGSLLGDGMSIVIDDMTGGGVAGTDCKIGVGFSEYLSEPAEKSNITVTNIETGEEINDFDVVSSDRMQCVLSFALVPKGMYTVTVHGVKGEVTGSETECSAEFYSAGELKNAAEERYYLMDEDFNDYTNNVATTYTYGNYDIPVGWRHADIATYNVNNTFSKNWDAYGRFEYNYVHGTIDSSKRGEGDYALKMQKPKNGNWGSNISYYFPKGVASGSFTMEFDIKHSNGGWGLALINYDNFDSLYTQRAYANLWNNDTTAASTDEMKTNAVTQMGLRTNMQFIGMTDDQHVGCEARSPYLGFTDELSNHHDSYVTKNDTNGNPAQIPAGTWTHIKADINTDSGVYTISITPEGGETQTVLWEDKVRGRFEKGVMGITLRNYIENNIESTWDNTVEFDNIQIYKNDSYLINQDFDDYVVSTDAEGKSYAPGGWYKMNEQFVIRYDQSQYTYKYAGITSGDGKDGGSAMQLTGDTSSLSNNTYLRTFTHAVNGGIPVAIEFDAKTSDNATGWQLHQFDQQDIMWLAGNNWTHHMQDGNIYWTTDANGRQQNCNAIIARMPNTNQIGYSRPDGAGSTVGDYLVPEDDIYIEGNDWVHYQIVITPVREDLTQYDIYVTEGEEIGTMRYTVTTRRNSLTNPIAGIGFVKTGSASGTATIDNVKVYEAEAYKNEYDVTMHREKSEFADPEIASVDVEYLNGAKDSLYNGKIVRPYVKRIAVNFTAPVALPMASEVEQPLNYSMTSTLVNSSDLSALQNAPAEQQVRYQVYDTVEDVITLTRVVGTSEKYDPEGEPLVTNKYFSDDRKTYYIELDNTMFAQDKDYVLRIAKDISFTTSAYATLDKEVTIQFGSLSAEEPETDVSALRLVRQAGNIMADVDSYKRLTDGGELTLVVEGFNEADEAKSLFIAWGQYRNDETGASMLENADCGEVEVEPGLFRKEITVNIDNEKDFDTFKAFAWNYADMKPYTDCITID